MKGLRERGSIALECSFLLCCVGAILAAALPPQLENGDCQVQGRWNGETFVDLRCTRVACQKECVIANLATPALEVCECPGQKDQACTTVVEVSGGQVQGFWCLQLEDCLTGRCLEETPSGATGTVFTVCLCR